MKLSSLLFALMLPVAMHAQGVRYDSNIFTATGNEPSWASVEIEVKRAIRKKMNGGSDEGLTLIYKILPNAKY